MSAVKGIIFDYGGTIDCCGDHWAVILREAYDTLPVPQIPLEDFIEAYVYAEREWRAHSMCSPTTIFSTCCA